MFNHKVRNIVSVLPIYTDSDSNLYREWKFCIWGHVYTGPDKFLHGQKLARFHLAFAWDRRNWTDFWTAKCASVGPKKSRSQTCTLSRSNSRPVPPVPCKRKVEPCKFLSMQIFVRTRVNVALKRPRIYLLTLLRRTRKVKGFGCRVC